MYFKSIVELDRAAIVICNLEHEIVYMNKAAIERYGKKGGAALIGTSLLDCHLPESNDKIKKVVAWFEESENNNMIYIYHNDKENKDNYMVAIRDDDNKLIGYYEKHEYRNPETAARYDFTKSLV